MAPSLTPSMAPSFTPSMVPSLTPSMVPSLTPSMMPSTVPSTEPTFDPAKWRCELVIDTFERRDDWMSNHTRLARHQLQAKSMDSFIESNIHLFWYDFVHTYNITKKTLEMVATKNLQVESQQLWTEANEKLLWTWVNGDQHITNFETSDNRRGHIVLEPHRYEETAIFDFQIDILRLLVTAYHHGVSKLKLDEDLVLNTVTDAILTNYVTSVWDYKADPDQATGFNLVNTTSSVVLKDFLNDMRSKKSLGQHVEEFTDLVGVERQFRKGDGAKTSDDDGVGGGGVDHSNIQ